MNDWYSESLGVEDILRELQQDVLTMPKELLRELTAEEGVALEDTRSIEHLKALLHEHKRAACVRDNRKASER